jgi:multicomponent Na+:H+ antiporter subunit E
MAARPAGPGWRAAGLWVAAGTAVWWLISGGEPDSWLVGAPAVAVAAWAGLRLGSRDVRLHMSLPGLLRFLAFFLWESLRGGLDVAFRTLRARPRVRPGFQHHHTGLPEGAARIFFVNCVSLLPGTLAADLQGDWVTVHVIDTEAENARELARLERAVARVFGSAPMGGR